MARKPKKWRQSDQTNSELPIGDTYIDCKGKLCKLIVTIVKDQYIIVHPEGYPEFCASGGGVNEAITNYDRKVSHERERYRYQQSKKETAPTKP